MYARFQFPRCGRGPLQNYGAAQTLSTLPSINSRPSFAMPKLCEPFFEEIMLRNHRKKKQGTLRCWSSCGEHLYFRFLRPRQCSSNVDSTLFFLSKNLQALIYRLSRFATTPGIYQVNSLLTLLLQHTPRSGGWIRICVDVWE